MRTDIVAIVGAWIVFAGALAVTTRPSAASAADEVGGRYSCVGTLPNGDGYTADLAIEKGNTHYSLSWSKDGQPVGDGYALLRNGVLSVIFQTSAGIGYGSYVVGSGELDGQWSIPTVDASFPEQCTAGGPVQRV